jgi:hypothetical protein
MFIIYLKKITQKQFKTKLNLTGMITRKSLKRISKKKIFMKRGGGVVAKMRSLRNAADGSVSNLNCVEMLVMRKHLGRFLMSFMRIRGMMATSHK